MKRELRRLKLVLMGLILMVTIPIAENYSNKGNELIVFHEYKKTIIGYRNGRSLTLFKNSSEGQTPDRGLDDYIMANRITATSEGDVPSVFEYKQLYFLIVDSTAVYPSADKKFTYILLRQSPKINLDRLIDSIQPQYIIADGSNFPSYVDRWRKTCLQRKLPFHHTGTKGAYIVN